MALASEKHLTQTSPSLHLLYAFLLSNFTFSVFFMPSSYLHLQHFLPKTPFKFFSLRSFSTIRNTDFNQDPPIVNKFLSLLQEFSNTLFCVKSIHAQIITNSVSKHHFLASNLVKKYSELGSLWIARKVFDQISQPKTILSNSMLNGYLRNQFYKETIELFELMCSSRLEFDSYSCNFVLKACMELQDFERGREVIKRAEDRNVDSDRFLGSSIISFFMKFGDFDGARRVFDRMVERDVVCWNSMIGGFVKGCDYVDAFRLFLKMILCGVRASAITMVSLIQACGGMRNLELGKCVHGFVLGLGMGCDVLVVTALIDMYSKIGEHKSARLVFDGLPAKNLVSWNVMLAGYVQNCLVQESFDLFRRLVMSGGGFDSGTIISLLQGCAQIADLESGRVLHSCIFRRGLYMNPILSTAIVDLYSKCGALKEATFVFERMKDRNVITWTAMLVGLAQNGHAEDAIKLFGQMQEAGVAANSITLVSLVHSCAHLGSLKKGRSVHAQLFQRGCAFDVVNRTALIDMYAKCGKINYAEGVFKNGSFKDIILCNCMISGYGMHGEGLKALDLYSRMIEEGLKPNQSTFISLLTACSHSGLVKQGRSLFLSMEIDHNISPTEKHYACHVDLLSRAGHLEEAEALIKQMPFRPSTEVFEALLNGCRMHKNIDIGTKTADYLLGLDATNPGIYVMLSNIYAEARRWDAVDHIRRLMRSRGLKKTPGYSLIEVGNQVHAFFAGEDSQHPKKVEINQILENLRLELEALGYMPDTSCVRRDVDEAMKIKLLWMHSERLAIAFGLLSTPEGSLLRITKNLRVCIDCHTVTKYISMVLKREIIVRDANRFHHFTDGKCSCNDYW